MPYSFTRYLVIRKSWHAYRTGLHPPLVTRQRLARIMEHQHKNGFSLWALIGKDTGRLIGDCGLILVEGRGPEIELSYDIARARDKERIEAFVKKQLESKSPKARRSAKAFLKRWLQESR